jgi:hypothetical protein
MISRCWWRFPNDTVDLLLPSLPLIFFWVNIVIEHCVVSREHGLDISDDQIECFPSNFIKGSSKSPDHTESKPFLKSPPVSLAFVLNVEISSFGIAQNKAVQKFSESNHDANLQAWDVFFELIFHLVFFGEEFSEPFLNELVDEFLDLFVFLFGNPTFDERTPS